MSESVPNASSVFSHRRPRADSTTSFAYYEEEDRDSVSGDWSDEDALIDAEEGEDNNADRQSLDQENTFMEPDVDEDEDSEISSQ